MTINIKPQERGLSDITQPLSPVEDRSGAVEMAGFASTIGNVSNVLQQGANLAERNAAEKQAMRRVQLEDEYVSGLNSLASGMEQGSLTTNRMLTELSGLEGRMSAQGLSSVEMMDLQIKHGRTLRGQVLEEGTEAEQVDKATRDLLIKERYLLPGATEEEKNKAALDFNRDTATQHALNLSILEANAKLKSQQLSDAEAKEVRATLKQQTKEKIKNLVRAEPSKVENELNTALDKKRRGEYDADPTLNEKLYQEDINRIERNNAQVYSLAALEDPEAAAPYRTILDSNLSAIYQAYRDSEDSAKLATMFKDSANVIKNKAEVQLLTDDDVAVAAAAVQLAGFNSPQLSTNLVTSVNNRVVEMAKAAEANASFPALLEKSETNEEYFSIVNRSIDALYSDEGADPETSIKQVNTILKTMGESGGERDLGQLVGFLSGEQFGKLLRDFPTAVPANIETLAQDAMNQYGSRMRDQSWTALSPILTPEQHKAKVEKLRKTNPRSAITISDQITTEDLELVQQGQSIVFRALTPKGKEKAQELNSQFASGYSTYYRGVANMERSSFAKGFDRDLPLIWPAKYGDQQEPTTQEAVNEVDYSQYEDGPYEDPETGAAIFIRNGIRIESRE